MKYNLVIISLALLLASCNSKPNSCKTEESPNTCKSCRSQHFDQGQARGENEDGYTLNVVDVFLIEVAPFSKNVIVELWYEVNGSLISKIYALRVGQSFTVPTATGVNLSFYAEGDYTLKDVEHELRGTDKKNSAIFIRGTDGHEISLKLTGRDSPKRKALQQLAEPIE